MLKFEFTEAEANYILSALGYRPHNEVRALMDKIVKQAKLQLPIAPVAEPQPTECAA